MMNQTFIGKCLAEAPSVHSAEAGAGSLAAHLPYFWNSQSLLSTLVTGCKNWPGMGGLTQGADLTSLEPSGNAVEVEGVVAYTPGDCAFLVAVGDLVRLALDAYNW